MRRFTRYIFVTDWRRWTTAPVVVIPIANRGASSSSESHPQLLLRVVSTNTTHQQTRNGALANGCIGRLSQTFPIDRGSTGSAWRYERQSDKPMNELAGGCTNRLALVKAQSETGYIIQPHVNTEASSSILIKHRHRVLEIVSADRFPFVRQCEKDLAIGFAR
jgi:hypothetical protein